MLSSQNGVSINVHPSAVMPIVGILLTGPPIHDCFQKKSDDLIVIRDPNFDRFFLRKNLMIRPDLQKVLNRLTNLFQMDARTKASWLFDGSRIEPQF